MGLFGERDTVVESLHRPESLHGPYLFPELHRRTVSGGVSGSPRHSDVRYAVCFGVLDRKTLSAELRLNWTFTPKASFQLYLQPYFTAGDYAEFRSLARPATFSFDPFIYPGNPDFNFRSLRANAVFRWEYRPGSTLYLVWTNEKAHFEEQNGNFSLSKDFSAMMRSRPANVLALKLTYWWTP